MIIHLSRDLLELDALFLFLFKLLLDVGWETLAVLGLDTVGGNLDLGLGMDALGGTSHVIQAELVEVAAETAELVLERKRRQRHGCRRT